jgi:hypothetical protein
MTEGDLRSSIIEMQRSVSGGEPGRHAIANHLSPFLFHIFEAEDGSELQRDALDVYGYSSIAELRKDAAALMISLSHELNPSDWQAYFGPYDDLLQRD